MAAGLSLGWFAVLFCIWAFTTGWVRGSMGDLSVVAWVAHSVGVVFPVDVRWRAGFALLLAGGLECGQLLGKVGPDDPEWMHIVFGSTFDPVDLAMYAVGALVAVGVEALLAYLGGRMSSG